MADFRTHISWGVFLGVIFVVLGISYSFFAGIDSIIYVFIAMIVGSFLPDLDLDDGIPFQIIFGLLGAGAGGLVFYDYYQKRSGENPIFEIVFVSGLVFVVVRFFLGYLFKKFTFHRGIFHSVPAGILAGLMTTFFLDFFNFLPEMAIILGITLSCGYVGHLLLDEIYSSINIQGLSFKTKKSLGSALKFYSSSKISTLTVYILIFFFLSALK